MLKPMASQAKNRSQVRMGKPDISRTQKNTLSTGAAMAAGIAITQDDYADRNQHERKERTDVGKIGERANIQKASRNANQKTSNPGCGCWSSKTRMHTTEKPGQQAVAGHRKPDSRLSQLEYQQRRNHAHHCAEENTQINPIQGVRTGLHG